MHVTCSDLHPGCSAHLWGRSAEELVLAYVLHHRDEHGVPQVELDDLLGAVTAQVPSPQPMSAVPSSRTLSLTG